MKPIPEMTDAELNEAMAVEAMAVEVMGGGDNYATIYAIEHYKQWNPTFDLNQAWECATEFLDENYDHDFGVYRVFGDYSLEWIAWLTWITQDKDEVDYKSRNANPARAICEAVLMAVRSER